MYNAQNTHLGMYTEPLQYATYLLQWLQISSMTPIRCLQQFKRHRHLKCVRSEKRSLLLPLVRKTLLMICPWNNHESVSETPKHLIFVGIYIYMYMPTPRVSDRPFLPSTTSLWVNHIILPSFQKNLRNWGKFQSKYLRYEGSNSFRSCWARLVSLKELTENDAKSTNLLQLEIKSFKEIIHTYHIKSVCNFKNYHALKIRYPINHLGTPVPPQKKKLAEIAEMSQGIPMTFRATPTSFRWDSHWRGVSKNTKEVLQGTRILGRHIWEAEMLRNKKWDVPKGGWMVLICFFVGKKCRLKVDATGCHWLPWKLNSLAGMCVLDLVGQA